MSGYRLAWRSRSDVPEQELDQRGEVVAVGGRLRRLAVGVCDHERVPVGLRHLEHRADGGQQVGQERGHVLLERHLEHGVVDVVPAAAGVELPGRLDPEAPLELGLDEEEEVLVLAGVDERRDVDVPLDVVERAQDRAGLRAAQEAPRGQHDRARAVDPHLLAPVVLLDALEERGEHRVAVHGRREPLLAGRRAHRPIP